MKLCLLAIGAIVLAPVTAFAQDPLPALPPPPPQPPAAASASASPSAPTDGAARAAVATATVRVHITSDHTVFLQKKDDAGRWADACTSPCDAELPVAAEYRVIGHGVDRTLTLEDRPGGVMELVVKTKSSVKTTLGATGVAVGGVAALVGLGIFANAASDTGFDCEHPPRNQSQYATHADCVSAQASAPGRKVAGLVTMAVSAVLVVGGIVLLVDGTSTGVEAPPPSAPNREAHVRLPTWTAPVAEGAGATFPLVWSGHF